MAEKDFARDGAAPHNEVRLTEIDYHKKLNRAMVFFAAPLFVFFACFHFYLGNEMQALLFFLLAVNAIAAVAAGYRIRDVQALVRLKYVSSAIGFILLAIALVTGSLSETVYIYYPWMFTYPVAVMLFFGPRNGFYAALAYTAVMSVVVFAVELPAWNDFHRSMFKLNTLLALAVILGMALISEKIRVRVQHDLVDARNEAELAEKRQREANFELQREIELRIRSENELARSEVRYRALFEESAASLWEEDWSDIKTFLDELPQEAADDLEGYFKTDPEALQTCLASIRITAVNRATLKLHEAENAATLLNNLPSILPPDATHYFVDRIVSLYRKGRYSAEAGSRTLKGRKVHLLVSSTVPVGYEETWQRIFTSVYDVTDRVMMEEEKKRMDRRLQAGRQIQAVATLAGGIAHQFNNALAIISGNLDLIRFDPKEPLPQDRRIGALQAAVDRMSRLTDQLLAYAQGGKYRPCPFSANDLIREILDSGKIELPEGVNIILDLDPDLASTSGDTTQIESVIEAILANAVESMQAEGRVTVATSNRSITENDRAPRDMPPGPYALISIEDMGIGMDEQTCQRIFEPFFTTKYLGRGLGMAAAFGIVKNHDGMITVHSEPGKGTRIDIYLPAAGGRTLSHCAGGGG